MKENILIDFPIDQIKASLSDLLRERVLIISGYWTAYTGSAVATINKQTAGLQIQRKQTTLVGSTPWIWDDLVSKPTRWGANALLTVTLDHPNGDIMLGELLFSVPEVDALKRKLAKNNRYLILQILEETHAKKCEFAGHMDPLIPVWALDELALFLGKHYGEQSAKMYHTAQEQIKAGTWGNRGRQALDAIKIAHDDGYLLARLHATRSQILDERVKVQGEVKSKLKQGGLEILVLFTATFFPGLSFESFDRIVCLFIDCQSQNEDNGAMVIERYDAIPISGETSLADRWRADADYFIESLGLVLVCDENNREVIRFQNPEAAESYRNEFLGKKRIFIMRQIESIRYSTMVFTGNDQELELLTKFVITAAIRNPDYYCREWLISLIGKIDQAASAEKFLERLIRIIQLFLADDEDRKFQNSIHQVLSDLIRQGKNLRLFQIVYRLARIRLIDPLPWVRQLLDFNHEFNTDLEAYVLDLILENRHTAPALMRSVGEWLPQRDTPPRSYKSGHCCALTIILNALIAVEVDVILKNPDGLVRAHPVWNQTTPPEMVDFMVDMLFHPGLVQILSGVRNGGFEDQIHRIAFANSLLEFQFGSENSLVLANDIWLRLVKLLGGMSSGKRPNFFQCVMIHRWVSAFAVDFEGAGGLLEILSQKLKARIAPAELSLFMYFYTSATQAISLFWLDFQEAAFEPVINDPNEDVRRIYLRIEKTFRTQMDLYKKTAKVFRTFKAQA